MTKNKKNSVKFVKIKILKYLKLNFIVYKIIMHFIDKILFKKKYFIKIQLKLLF